MSEVPACAAGGWPEAGPCEQCAAQNPLRLQGSGHLCFGTGGPQSSRHPASGNNWSIWYPVPDGIPPSPVLQRNILQPPVYLALSVADPGCFRVFPIPDPGSASKNLSILSATQKIVSKLSKIWSGLLILDPDPDFFTHPGSRGQKGHRILDPDPQQCLLYEEFRFVSEHPLLQLFSQPCPIRKKFTNTVRCSGTLLKLFYYVSVCVVYCGSRSIFQALVCSICTVFVRLKIMWVS